MFYNVIKHLFEKSAMKIYDTVNSEKYKNDRVILHSDCNCFYASVECLLNPKIRNYPVAVSGDAENRHGIILAKNEIAKKYGIKTGEAIWQAKAKCRDLIMVPARLGLYKKYSDMVRRIYSDYTDRIEPFGLDESWLDVSENLTMSGLDIAKEISCRIKAEIGITVSIGVSFNKIFAKFGSDYKKPDATTVISRENYQQIAWALPASSLLFVGHSTKETLEKWGIRTIGELAAFDPAVLEKRLGKAGAMLSRYARGEDNESVASICEQKEMKSIGNSITFKRNLITWEDIRIGTAGIADMVASRLRKHKVKCWTVQVIIKDVEFKSISRQKTLITPTNLAKELEETALELIRKHWKIGKPIRMLGIQTSSLIEEGQEHQQLNLFVEETAKHEKQQKAETVLDEIRKKFGKGAVTKANILHNDIGVGMENWQNKE